MSHLSLLSKIRGVRSARSRSVSTPCYLLCSTSRDRVVRHLSPRPIRATWEGATKKSRGTAVNAGCFGRGLCVRPASIVIIDVARVAFGSVKDGLGILLSFPHNNRSYVTL
jgi:hypothetical protein